METEVYDLSPDMNVRVVAHKLSMGYGVSINQKRTPIKKTKAKAITTVIEEKKKEEEEEEEKKEEEEEEQTATPMEATSSSPMEETMPLTSTMSTKRTSEEEGKEEEEGGKKKKRRRKEKKKWSAVKKMCLDIREWRRLKEVLPDVLADYRAFEAALAENKDVYFHGYRRRISPDFALELGPPDSAIFINDDDDDDKKKNDDEEEHYEVCLIDLRAEETPEIGDDRIQFTETELSRFCNYLPIINRRLIQHLSKDKVITLNSMADVIHVNRFVQNFYDGESGYTKIVLLKKPPKPSSSSKNQKSPIAPSPSVDIKEDGVTQFRIIGIPPHAGVVVERGVIPSAAWQECQTKRRDMEEGPEGRVRKREQEKMDRDAGKDDGFDDSDTDLSTDDEVGWSLREMKERYEDYKDGYAVNW